MVLPKLLLAQVAHVIAAGRHHLGQLQRRLAPAPLAVLEMILNAWAAQAITAAADLRIADVLAKGPLTAEELAAAVGADADALSRLLRALISRGIFRQNRDGRYGLNPLADTLRTDAEVSVAAMARFVGAPQHREHWSHLTEAIRTGQPVIPALRGKPLFEYLADEPEFAEIFNDAMTSGSEAVIGSVIAGYDFGRYATIVDGGDAYVLKSVIHDWPDEDAVRILGNVRSAAGAGKTVLLVENVIPRNNREFAGKWTDLEMLVVAGARERTAAEYDRLLAQAGFRMTRVVATASSFSVVEALAI